jgi:hypothetical protein
VEVRDVTKLPDHPKFGVVTAFDAIHDQLAEGGAGLGAVWGVELARQMLAEAGFSSVDVHDCPRPQNCIFVCRPAAPEQPRA